LTRAAMFPNEHIMLPEMLVFASVSLGIIPDSSSFRFY
jgi:hypothetical protein